MFERVFSIMFVLSAQNGLLTAVHKNLRLLQRTMFSFASKKLMRVFQLVYDTVVSSSHVNIIVEQQVLLKLMSLVTIIQSAAKSPAR